MAGRRHRGSEALKHTFIWGVLVFKRLRPTLRRHPRRRPADPGSGADQTRRGVRQALGGDDGGILDRERAAGPDLPVHDAPVRTRHLGGCHQGVGCARSSPLDLRCLESPWLDYASQRRVTGMMKRAYNPRRPPHRQAGPVPMPASPGAAASLPARCRLASAAGTPARRPWSRRCGKCPPSP